MPLPQQNESYTYSDYCTWDDGERWELIDGVPYAMSPAPSSTHQAISGELFGQLRDYLKGKPCKVYHAPLDVRLKAEEEDDTVVQPDLVVICDRSKIDEKGCKGTPDLAIEILSPSTARMDRVLKFQLYQRAGVREYWIVDPTIQSVQVCVLQNGAYVTSVYTEADMLPVTVLEGCSIQLGMYSRKNKTNSNQNPVPRTGFFCPQAFAHPIAPYSAETQDNKRVLSDRPPSGNLVILY